MTSSIECLVCRGPCARLDALDLNRSCEADAFPAAGRAVEYVLCERCGFCFAPEFLRWTAEDFERLIYNSDYARADPDYVEARPRSNAESLASLVGDGSGLRHLDYGGGNGLLSALMREKGWQSRSHDTLADRRTVPQPLGQFDLITAYEVFEHAPEPRKLAAELASLLAPEGVVLFSTLLSDGNIRAGQPLAWWYAAPRNGHVSLYSSLSLAALGATQAWTFASFSPNFHAFWKTLPPWASRFIRLG